MLAKVLRTFPVKWGGAALCLFTCLKTAFKCIWLIFKCCLLFLFWTRPEQIHHNICRSFKSDLTLSTELLYLTFLLWHPFVNLYSLNWKQRADLKGTLQVFSCYTSVELICFWFPSPFSPVGPDWRNVSSCERWLPCCGICPVAGRLALLLGQPE